MYKHFFPLLCVASMSVSVIGLAQTAFAAQSASFSFAPDEGTATEATQGNADSFTIENPSVTWRATPLKGATLHITIPGDTIPVSSSSSEAGSSAPADDESTEAASNIADESNGGRRGAVPSPGADAEARTRQTSNARTFNRNENNTARINETSLVASVDTDVIASGVVQRRTYSNIVAYVPQESSAVEKNAALLSLNVVEFGSAAGVHLLRGSAIATQPLGPVVGAIFTGGFRRRKKTASSPSKKKRHPVLRTTSIGAMLLVAAVGCMSVPRTAHAASDVPNTIAYNGRMLTSTGAAVTHAVTLRFSFWSSGDKTNDDITESGLINAIATSFDEWQETHTITPDDNGHISVSLGTVTTLPDISSLTNDIYMQVDVKVASAADSAFETLDPDTSDDTDDRFKIQSVPFALNAGKVNGRMVGSGSGAIPLLESGGMIGRAHIPDGTARDSFTIDSDGIAASSIRLLFGHNVTRALSYDLINNRFDLSNDLFMHGSLTATGSIAGASLSGGNLTVSGLSGCTSVVTDERGRLSCGIDLDTQFSNTGALRMAFDARYVPVAGGTMTGSLMINATGYTTGLSVTQAIIGGTIHATSLLTSSGNLVVNGNMSGNSLAGAGLSDCGTDGKLIWNAGTKTFSCGTDRDTQFSNTGSLQFAFDRRYVQTAGGTMTGSLRVSDSISGTTIHADTTLESSGSLTVQGDTRLKGNLLTTGTVSGSALTVTSGTNYMLGSVGIGTTAPDAALEVNGTMSGKSVYQTTTAKNFFKGAVGIGTGASVYTLNAFNAASTSFVNIETGNGASNGSLRMANPDQAWVMGVRGDLNNNFAFADSTHGLIRFTIGQTNGYVGIGTTTPRAKLSVSGSGVFMGTVSGSGLHASSTLTTSGSLTVKGTALFKSEPQINGTLGTQEFAVSCDVRSGAFGGGNVIPDLCYAWVPFPLSYASTPTSVSVTAGSATGGASSLTVNTKMRTGFLAQWSCNNTQGQCGFLSASYTVSP